MAKLLAPILAFTCDESWQAMPHRVEDDPRNILMNRMQEGRGPYALAQEAMEKWDVAIRLRQDVNAVLETARAAKRIGKALEAHVALEATDPDAAGALEAVRELDLAELCIVSSCTPESVPEEATQGQGTNFPGLRIGVTEAKGTKCPRCWMHSLQANEEGLCPRCAGVISRLPQDVLELSE